MKDIDAPKLKKTLPRYLTLDESIALLESVDGPNRERDLLHPDAVSQLRIADFGADRAEPVSDVHEDALRVLGKGNKVRIVYLNEACQDALQRLSGGAAAHYRAGTEDALFLSARESTDQPLHGPRPGEKAPVPRRAWTAPSIPPTSCATPPPP